MPHFVRSSNSRKRQLAGTEAAQGITHSGAGINAFGNLGAQQAGALASADAPLFSQGLQGATGIYSEMPGAQNNAYNDAIQQFYQALQTGASAFAGGFGGGGSKAAIRQQRTWLALQGTATTTVDGRAAARNIPERQSVRIVTL